MPEKPADQIELLSREMAVLANTMRPQGLGPVATSPFFELIIRQTMDGLTPKEIFTSLPVNNSVQAMRVPSTADIASYVAKHVPPELRIAYRQIEKYRDVRESANPFQTLLDLLHTQRSRIGEALVRDQDGTNGDSVRKEIDLGRRLCLNMIKVAQELGQLPYVMPSGLTPVAIQDDRLAPRLVLRAEKSTENQDGTTVTESKTAILSDLRPEDAAYILSQLGEEIGPSSAPSAPPSPEDEEVDA